MDTAPSAVTCLRKLRRSAQRSSMLTSSGRRRALPAEPVDDGATHHPLEVAAPEPRPLLGAHRDALPIRARHAGDVGAAERALGPERFEDLAQVAVAGFVRLGLARRAWRARPLDRHGRL